MPKIKQGGETLEARSKTFEEFCEFFNHSITEKDLDKWGEVAFNIRMGKEMDIAPLPGVLEVEMIYGNNIMRTRMQR